MNLFFGLLPLSVKLGSSFAAEPVLSATAAANSFPFTLYCKLLSRLIVTAGPTLAWLDYDFFPFTLRSLPLTSPLSKAILFPSPLQLGWLGLE